MSLGFKRIARFAAFALTAAFLVAAAYCVARLLDVRAYSDPANWLYYARHLKEEFVSCKWPVIYPLFLWVCEMVVGPIYIFLLNFPVLVLLLGGVGVVAARAVSLDNRDLSARLSPWPVITTAFLVLAFDPSLFVYLVNPYRDPLGLLLRVGSVLFLILSIQPQRRQSAWIWAGVSGLLLGLSVAVREPGILMVLPMLGFGVWMGCREKHICFIRHACCFAVGLVIGASPLVIQTLLVTGQVLKPTQSVADKHLIPGMEVSLAGQTTAGALSYYWDQGIWLPLIALGGAIWAVWRRQAVTLCLLVLPCVLYAVFYCFYWTFVPRYFYFSTICMGGLGACLLHGQAWHWLQHRSHRVQQSGQIGLSIVVMIFALVLLANIEPGSSRFSLAAARDFAEWIERTVPTNSVVFTQRNLCELIRILGPRESYPLREGMPDICQDALPAKELVDRLLTEKREVFIATFPRSQRRPFEQTILERFYEIVPVATRETEAFGLADRLGKGAISLCKVIPWTARTSACVLSSDGRAQGDILTIYGASFTQAVPGAHAPELWIGENRIADSVADGLSFVKLPHGSENRIAEAELRSTMPIPKQCAVSLKHSKTDTFEVDLGFSSQADSTPFLTGMGQTFRHHPRVVRLTTNGTVRLPTIWEPGTVVMATMLFNGPTYALSNAPLLSLSYAATPSLQLRAARRRSFHRAAILASVGADPAVVELTLKPSDRCSPEPLPWVDIDRVLLRAINTSWNLPYRVVPGAADWLAASGFYTQGAAPDQTRTVWTDGCGQIWLCVTPGTDVDVTVRYWDLVLPPDLRKASVSLLWNGQPLEVAMHFSDDGSYGRANARLTTRPDAKPYGLLTIVSTTWRPCEWLDMPDPRPLGLMIKDINLVPASSGLLKQKQD